MLEKIDLTFVQTDAMLDELMKRHDAMVFTGVRFTKVNGDYIVKRYRNGNRFVCCGLMDTFQHMIEQEENNAMNGIPHDKQGDK